MATSPKTHIGTMACLCCGHDIPVKTAETGTINAACPWCDFPAYAKVGTQAHKIIMGKLTPVAAAVQVLAKTAPVATPAPPPAKVSHSIFHGLGAKS